MKTFILIQTVVYVYLNINCLMESEILWKVDIKISLMVKGISTFTFHKGTDAQEGS